MKFPFNGEEYYIDGFLASQLNSICYNLPNDWDIILLITGDRAVRTGKSVLAITICAYLSYALTKMGHYSTFGIDDVYFDNKEMTSAAQKKPKYAINLYDEGREGLAASKAMKQFSQDLIDFFTECGQLNQAFVIVAPDFFELKEYMAVGRAELLINVYRKEKNVEVDLFKNGKQVPVVKFVRGSFEFFNRGRKQQLYDKAKSSKKKTYGLVRANFVGSFTNQYPIDEGLYRKKKEDALKRFDEKHKEGLETRNTRTRNNFILYLSNQGFNSSEIKTQLEEQLLETLSIRQINSIRQDKGQLHQNTKKSGVFSGGGDTYTTKLTKTNEIVV